eukprot:GHUV01035154.1.p1 GENE.GHUV01035154.1~~GHUV01035154.1.p1  ORF type:complete len:189 (+),score=44.25 GHUV01035154.1:837-1403(+)
MAWMLQLDGGGPLAVPLLFGICTKSVTQHTHANATFGTAGTAWYMSFLAGRSVVSTWQLTKQTVGCMELPPHSVQGLTRHSCAVVAGDCRARANGVEYESTKSRGKPIVYLYGSRPFTGGMCEGVEQAMASMKAGGKRVITVPPELGFGDKGFMLRPTEHVPDKQGIIPPGATLEFELELVRVSIPPS